MIFQHTYPSPPRLVAPGGPLSAAIRIMREANDLSPLLAEQFDSEAAEIRALRETIKRQLAADFDRIDRCLVILDTLSGDPDLEPSLGFVTPGYACDGEVDAGEEPEEENEHGGDIQDEPHDAEEDCGAEEDEGLVGYRLHRSSDPSASTAAREAHLDLDSMLRSQGRRLAPRGNSNVTLIGPCGSPYRVTAL